jgi:membrane-bound lytic murein transglycosylase D
MTTGTLQNLKARIRYQRGIKEKFRESLIRSGLYLDRMRSIFESYNLPAQLTYLPHVESSFDYTAYSKAGAAGIWQFTRGTGRSYLRINGFMDERLDPVRATDAAARLMRDNYAVLGNWPLTITSYNHGKNGMLRAKSQYGNDITRIIDNYKSRYFGFASKNFYAEFLAALYVAENYEKYFGSLPIAAPLEFDTIRTEKPYDSSYYTTVPGLSFEILSSYNPHLRRVFARSGRVVPAGIDLRVPIGKGEPLRVALQNARPSASGLILASDGSTRYRVRPGDVLGNIAADFGTSVDSIKSLNRIKNANRIYPGQMLLVTPPTGAVSSGTRSAEPAVPSVYRVRSGDSLTNIAKRFRTDVDELARLNSISNPNRLYPGMKLRISPGNEEETRIYQVRPGDTLAKIARRFGTSVSSLKRANRIRNPHLIKEGQELVIP